MAVRIAAGAAKTTVRMTARWIGGYDFEPGDPLITAASFWTIDGQPLATWVAGDAPVVFPSGAARRLPARIDVTILRRVRADYERAVPAKASVLRVLPRANAPRRVVRVATTPCGTPHAGTSAQLLAVRPLLADGAASRLWLERPGSPRAIVGWFRDARAAYPRTYWLARPLDLVPESRVQSDTACTVELTVVSGR